MSSFAKVKSQVFYKSDSGFPPTAMHVLVDFETGGVLAAFPARAAAMTACLGGNVRASVFGKD